MESSTVHCRGTASAKGSLVESGLASLGNAEINVEGEVASLSDRVKRVCAWLKEDPYEEWSAAGFTPIARWKR